MERVKLGDLFDIGSSKRILQSDWRKEGIPFYRAREIVALSLYGYVENDLYIEESLYEEYTSRYGKPESGDIMVTGVGTIGICYIVRPNDRFYYKDASILCFHQKHPELVFSEYVAMAFKTPLIKEQLDKNSSGSTVATLTIQTANKLEIKLPSVEEQKIIVSNLKKIETIIELRNRELNRFDDLIKARFVELFEDGESPIKTVAELCSDIVDCPHTTPKYTGELKNPAIRTSEIKKGYITWDSMRYVSDEEYEERVSRLRPEAGDIVYGREGTFGNAAVLPKGYKFCLGQRVMLLRPDYEKCTSEYLLHAVISDDVYRQAVGKNNASTVAHVNVKDVKQFKIPLPSFDKQNQFAEFVKQVDKSKVA